MTVRDKKPELMRAPWRRCSRRLIGVLCGLLLVAGPPMTVSRADDDLLGGIGDIVGGALSIPYGALAGTLSGPPIIGTVSGTLLGVLNTLSQTSRGVLRLIGVAIPLAERAAPFIPLFL